MPLTYVRMVRRQHATSELQHTFLHRKRIRVPSQRRVRLGEIAHGHACASSDNPYRHNQQQSAHAAPLHTCPSPMSGWSAGSTRRLNSSTLSVIASASECLPSAEYVVARLPMAVPARQATTHTVTISNKAHVQHHSTHAPHLCEDGPQAARDV